jgi:formamidopyrimidine-DNA glycosylase
LEIAETKFVYSQNQTIAMPELPDLQAFSKNLTTKLKGKKVMALRFPYTKKLKIPATKFSNAIEGAKIENIRRVGKELYFEFDNGNVVSLHLMLRGNMYLFDKKHEQRFPIVEFYFNDSTGLVMTDFQGQANATLNPEERDSPDAMSKDVNFKFMKALLSRKASVKNVMLDQKLIRGIGNAYADEILWDAGISPFSVSNKIPDEKIKMLVKSIRSVMTKAEKSILKSNPDIITGEVRDFLPIHNSKKKTSPTGAEIKIEVVGGRKTYYTNEQKLYK